MALSSPLQQADLESSVTRHRNDAKGPSAVRIDGRFSAVHVRSVARQPRPYPPLAAVLGNQHVSVLVDVAGTMVRFGFGDAVGGMKMPGWHMHFVSEECTTGGHVLSYAVGDAVAQLDDITDLQVALPPAVDLDRGAALDQQALRHLETKD